MTAVLRLIPNCVCVCVFNKTKREYTFDLFSSNPLFDNIMTYKSMN